MSTTKIKTALDEAKDKLIQLNLAEELVSEIEWCLGSYAFDENPTGLYQKGKEAHQVLIDYKATHPRKVSKKLLDDLEKAISTQQSQIN